MRLLTKTALVVASVVTACLIGATGFSQREPGRSTAGEAERYRGGHALLPYLKPLALIQRSSLIVEGIVAGSSESSWNSEGTLLYTDLNVLATKVLKGDPDTLYFTVRNPGGTLPGTTDQLAVGDAPKLKMGDHVLLLLTTEDLPYLDMTSGQQYYVTGWAGGIYNMSSEGQLVNQLHPEFNESVTDFELRVAAVRQGLPDPKPIKGLPIFSTKQEAVIP